VSGGWRARAACAGQQDLFFDGRREAAARAVCARCPVRRQCATLAITSGAEFGTWGGMTEAELRARRVKTPGRSPVIRISRPRGPARKAA
jgi:WhiB family redox-sensing transcriptional regulator